MLEMDVQGLRTTLAALKVIDPVLAKRTRANLTKVQRDIATKTRRRAPVQALSGWGTWGGRLDYDVGQVRGGIKALSGGAKLNLRLINKSAQGVIFERAGEGTPSSPLALSLTKMYGEPPRLLVKTWREEKGITKAASAIGRAKRFAEARVEERLA